MKRYVELLKLTGFEPEGAGVPAEDDALVDSVSRFPTDGN